MPRYVDIEPYEKEGFHLEKTITNQFGVEICTVALSNIPTADVIENPDKVHWLKWENGKHFGKIECPMLGGIIVDLYVPNKGHAWDSYTAPFLDSDGDVLCYKFDEDEQEWLESPIVVFIDWFNEKLYLK